MSSLIQNYQLKLFRSRLKLSFLCTHQTLLDIHASIYFTQVCLVEEFDILQIVGEGWFGKILLVEHRASDTEIVLKALPKPYVSIRDFYREFHYGLHLSAHKNIVTTFDVAFETAGFYVFCQEYAPLGKFLNSLSVIAKLAQPLLVIFSVTSHKGPTVQKNSTAF